MEKTATLIFIQNNKLQIRKATPITLKKELEKISEKYWNGEITTFLIQ